MNGIRVIALLILALPLAVAHADIYKCLENGATVFSDKKCSDTAEKVQLKLPPTNTDDHSAMEDIWLAKVEPHCTSNGYGSVSCTFQNNTNEQASICIVVEMKRTRLYRNYENQNYRSSLKTSEICSGLLQPHAVIERSASFAGVDNDVNEMCSPKKSGDDWRELCKMIVKAVSG